MFYWKKWIILFQLCGAWINVETFELDYLLYSFMFSPMSIIIATEIFLQSLSSHRRATTSIAHCFILATCITSKSFKLLKTVNYFRKMLSLRCLTGFWLRLCLTYLQRWNLINFKMEMKKLGIREISYV